MSKTPLMNQKQIDAKGRIGYFLLCLQSAFSICIPTFMTIYGTNVLGIKIATLSLMMALVKVLDGVTDVLAGIMIDKTYTKMGKARPWLLWIAVPYGLCFALQFCIPPYWGATVKLVLLAVFYALTVSVFGTIIGIATSVLLPRMSTNPKELAGFGSVAGAAGVVLCGFLMAVVFPLQAILGFDGTFILFGSIVFVLTMCGFLLCRELPYEVLEAAITNKGRAPTFSEMFKSLAGNMYAILLFFVVMLVQIAGGFIMGCGTYYAIYVLGGQNYYSTFMLIGAFGSLVGMFISPFLVKKISPKWTYILGCCIAAIGFFAIRLSGDNVMVVNIAFFFILMGGQTFTNGVNRVFTMQVVDYGEWKNHTRTEGTLSCTGNVGNKIGAALGSALIGVFLGAGGFVEGGVEQTAAAIQSIKMTYTIATPVAYLVLAIFFMIVWQLPKKLPQINKELAERRAAGMADIK